MPSPPRTPTTARVSLDPPLSPLLMRVGEWWSRRRYGAVLAPGRAWAHHPRALWTLMRFERGVEGWRVLPERLRVLATLAAAVHIECAWCLDFGSWVAAQAGVTEEKVRHVARPDEVPGIFDDTERAVLAYAEAMTATPPQVTDALAADLRGRLGDAGLVELTAIVAVENLRARSNHALGLPGQGFAADCAVPTP